MAQGTPGACNGRLDCHGAKFSWDKQKPRKMRLRQQRVSDGNLPKQKIPGSCRAGLRKSQAIQEYRRYDALDACI